MQVLNMRLCVNHQDRSSTHICHYCGDECCEHCVEEGILYWYCKKSECSQALQKEISSSLPENVICPACESQLLLDPQERFEKKLTCSTCKAVLDFNYDPPNISLNENSDLSDLELQIMRIPVF
jgi:transcription initiation factor IIE alpha subunit